ncbi:ECF transporter S component [Candidatus Bathyarchaeota archaeon]|nr:ECF transporter S component [Candidatus Bathyarchaeota archaeon]
MLRRKSVVLAYIAVFSSLSLILATVRAEVPFPPLPYLKFDFAEVPVMMVFMLGGPISALIAETIHWIGLISRGGWLGPTMKFLAVTPMIGGFWIGIKTGIRLLRGHRKISLRRIFLSGMIIGIILRVIVCTFTNIMLFLFISPGYLQFAEATLKTVGIKVTSTLDVWIWTLMLTGIFNAIHVPLSSIISLLILKAALRKIPIIAKEIWLLQL